jgi:hypothetical protein
MTISNSSAVPVVVGSIYSVMAFPSGTPTAAAAVAGVLCCDSHPTAAHNRVVSAVLACMLYRTPMLSPQTHPCRLQIVTAAVPVAE